MAEDIKRLHYFDRQFLREQDFNDEQGYHLGLARDHARLLHAAGIAEGLTVPTPASGATAITVTAGVAYDLLGRRMVLAEDTPLDLAAEPPGADVFVTITYRETLTDPSDEGGSVGFTRWTESPLLELAASTPSNPTERLLLARIERSGTTVTAVDLSGRLSAGLAAGTVGAAALADDAVTSAKLAAADGTSLQDTSTGLGVKTGHLQDAAVTTAKLADGAVTTAKLALAAVTSDRLAAGSVTVSHLAAGNVDTTALANNAVTLDKLADNAVNSAKIADGSVGTLELADGAVTAAKLAGGVVAIPNAAVTEAKLADNAVTSAKIAEAEDSFLPGRNAQDTDSGTGIKTGHLQNGAVTPAKLADGAVIGDKIADGAVTGDKIADGSVGTAELGDGAVTTTKIAEGSITGTKFVPDLTISGRVGIGAPPAFALDVLGRMRVRQGGATNPTAGVWFSGYYRQEFDAAFFGMQNETTAGIFGNLGNPNWRLLVALDTGDLTVAGNAFKPGGGAWGTSSDARLKQEIQPLDGALDRLAQLKPIRFEWKEPATQGNLTGAQMGFLAQDVEAVFPQWVGVDAQGYKTLTIRGFEALAVEALKELRAENEQLKATLADLLQKIEALEQRRRR